VNVAKSNLAVAAAPLSSAGAKCSLFRRSGLPYIGTAMTIVTYVHRQKRSRKRKAQAATIAGPMIVTAKSKRTHRQVADVVASDEPATIVTAKHPHRRGGFGDVPDMTPEEHKRRGDAADALFREMKRQIAAPAPPKRKAHKQAKRRARFRELLRRVREE
jgi:hypothetical protein